MHPKIQNHPKISQEELLHKAPKSKIRNPKSKPQNPPRKSKIWGVGASRKEFLHNDPKSKIRPKKFGFWILDSGFWVLGRPGKRTARQFSDGALRWGSNPPWSVFGGRCATNCIWYGWGKGANLVLETRGEGSKDYIFHDFWVFACTLRLFVSVGLEELETTYNTCFCFAGLGWYEPTVSDTITIQNPQNPAEKVWILDFGLELDWGILDFGAQGMYQ